MESLFLLIPLSVLTVFAIGWVLWRAVENGQFDDLDGPGQAVIMDDDRPVQESRAAAPRTNGRGDIKDV